MKKIEEKELQLIADYVNEMSGIILYYSKAYLVESRLGPILEREGFSNYLELHNKAKLDKTGELSTCIVNAITTNETSFFRDEHPFQLLVHKLVPDHFERYLGKGGSSIKPSVDIWCAASSTGQEIYSIAMALKEMLGDFGKYRINILGTDISKEALGIASSARYGKIEIARGLSGERLRRHFDKSGDLWRIRDELRSVTKFKHANLMEPISSFGQFDIVFCRYVAIYFSAEKRKILFKRIADQLRSDGVLIIGGTESLFGVSDMFKRKEFHGSVYYQKKPLV